jgi:soluble lytic murein transglycosylase-like protein
MAEIRKFIFPAVFLASAAIICLTRALYSPDQTVLANSDLSDTGQEPTLQIEAIETQAVPADGSTCSIPASYPDSIRQSRQPIEQYAAYYGLDPKLIAAVMLQESGGDPYAYSKSGAVGLMQVMPRDGIAADFMCINGPCFTSRPTMEELFDPHFNIAYGTGLLSGLISKYGDEREGLKAYGPMDRGYEYADRVLSIYTNYR